MASLLLWRLWPVFEFKIDSDFYENLNCELYLVTTLFFTLN